MSAAPVEKQTLRTAFRKAFLTGIASLSLLIGVGTARAQTNAYPQQGNKTEQVDRHPWQDDADYIAEMEAARRLHESRVEALRARTDARVVQIETTKEQNITRLYTGTIRLIYAATQVKVYKQRAEADIQKAYADEQVQLSNLETQFLRQQQMIENKYKNAYMRNNPNYGKNKSEQEQKLDDIQLQIKIKQQEIKLQQLEQQLEKQKQQLEQQKKQNSPAPKR